jgi:hypothetical protein
MKRLTLIILIVAIIAVFIFALPFLLINYFWLYPLQQKRQDIQNYENLCKEWNAASCAGNPKDELCKAAAGRFATELIPLNTQKCSDIASEGIQLLRTSCCGR